MAFSIVHPESAQMSWVPVLAADICYVGQLVSIDVAAPLEGVFPMPVVSGNNNTANKDIPMGVVIGTNNTAGNLETSSTYGEMITAEAAGTAYGNTKMYQGVEGPWPRGDRIAMVLIHHIDPCTILRAPICNAALGTAPTEVTVSTACGGDGIGCTTSAADAATNANFATIYMRSGANQGVYRTLTSASTTAHVWLQAMPGAVAVGDKAVVINGLRPYGPCETYIDAEGMYLDCSETLDSNNIIIHVRRLDLSVAGGEYVEFRFDGDNFCATRA